MDVIETDRLRLRPFTLDDAPALFEVFRLPEVARWSGTAMPMTDVAEAVARIERWSTRGGSHPATGVFTIDLLDSGAMIGTALLVPLPPSAEVDRDDFEVGWHLHPDAWGHGYATEAAAVLLARGFGSGMTEIFAVTDPDNQRSQAVCARLGMEALGLRSSWYDRELATFRKTPDRA